MMTLKDLTWNMHKLAESADLMKAVLDNSVSAKLYCDLVYTKYLIYSEIEQKVQFSCRELKRAQPALDDWQDMKQCFPPNLPALDELLTHIRNLDNELVWAHVYVHYLAPLYGGQIIKKIIENRFPTRVYQFNNPQECIDEVRKMCKLEFADEANLSFKLTREYYDQLYLAHQQNG